VIAKLLRALEEETSDDRPWLEPPGDLLDTTVRAWDRIVTWGSPTDRHRFLARFGDAIVRLERSDNGALGTKPLDVKRVVNLLSRVARWSRQVEHLRPIAELLTRVLRMDIEELLAAVLQPCPPPEIVARNLLADPEPGLPVLERVVEVPVLAPDGTIHDRPGYDPASRCFYAPSGGLEVPPVSEYPTDDEVAAARGLILDELVVDFPFASDAERAHAVMFLLEPFARVLIDGSTPLYLFEAPTPGTGKTLLVEALAVPMLGGRRLTLMAEARDPDEWRKRLTAKLRNGPAFLVIDNLRRALDAGPLAMTITAGEVEDRLLGVSETVTLPVRCTLAATANNPTLSDEMTRRVVRIRLDTGMEQPEEREDFRHAHLLRWARDQRGELIWAALTLARAWVAAGMPTGPERALGSFEEWTHVMGGILHVAGIEGMLTNRAELRAESLDTQHGDFLQAVYAAEGGAEWTSAAVVGIAREVLNLGDVPDQVAAQRLGTRLRGMVDRPSAGLILRRSTLHSSSGSRKWRIDEATGARPSVPPVPPAPSGASTGSTDGTGGDPDLEGQPATCGTADEVQNLAQAAGIGLVDEP
jgi:putative DNA primase/helicase